MGGYIGPGIATQIDGYTQSQTDAKLTPTNVSDKDNASTGAFDLPSGTTAQRPASPNTGYTRYNTTIGAVETWNGTAWVTSGGLVLQAVQTANFTATAGNSYPVNTTSGAITVTLPASPTAGQQVNVFDYAGTAATNTITINPNGGKINGGSGNAVISTVRASVTLVYVDSTQGWVDVAVGNAVYLPQQYSVSYLIIGGGGSGGKGTPAVCWGGGGGGGGLQNSTYTVTAGNSYSVVVGAGGAGSSTAGTSASGNSSSVFAVTSGGGIGGNATSSGWGGNSGTPQSNSGAHVGINPGGGGASAANSATTTNGAAGAVNSISGSSVYYTGGGGSGGDGGITGSGGTGGGGTGAPSFGTPTSGSANTGGGGGGMRGDDAPAAGSGGSGVVILSVPTANYSGITTGSPTVTTSGSNTIIKFTSSGSYTA